MVYLPLGFAFKRSRASRALVKEEMKLIDETESFKVIHIPLRASKKTFKRAGR